MGQLTFGSVLIKTLLTHGAILCVTGDRKLTFSTAMVTTTESVTSTMVKSRYLPKRGTVSEVGGMISASSRKNTVRDSRIEMQSDT